MVNSDYRFPCTIKSLPTSLSSKENSLAQVILTVFGQKGILANNEAISKIISNYIPLEAIHLTSRFSSFVNLSDPAVLKDHLALSYQSHEDVNKAMEVSKRIYEAAQRGVNADGKYGLIFPADAEVLSFAMKLIKKQKDAVLCELACAEGGNGLLCAFAGAKQVIFNDFDREAIIALRRQIQQLPSKLQSACKVDEGSCFDLLSRNPDLENRVDLILCRNLIHFFNNQEQVNFFELVKKMLTSGGLAIFTANSVYSIGGQLDEETRREVTQCEESSFENHHIYLHNYARPDKGRMPQILASSIQRCSDELLSGTKFTASDLYLKNSTTGFKWKGDSNEFKKLNKKMKDITKRLLEESKPILQEIPCGSIRFVKSHTRRYNIISLSRLLESHGFNVNEVFLVNDKGHLIRDLTQAYDDGQQLGILVSKP